MDECVLCVKKLHKSEPRMNYLRFLCCGSSSFQFRYHCVYVRYFEVENIAGTQLNDHN